MTRNPANYAVLAIGLAACAGASPHSKEAGAVNAQALAVHPVSWNPAGTPIGKARAVADGGDVVVVFADDGATVFRSGAVVDHDTSAHQWVSGAAIPSVDGASHWVVGIDRKGGLYYLRGQVAFDDASDRYGLSNAAIRDVAVVGAPAGASRSFVAFALDDALAIADGSHLTRYASAKIGELSAGGSTIAATATDAILVFDPTAKTVKKFDLPGARFVAVTTDDKIYAATSNAIYVANANALSLILETSAPSIHGLVASGTHVWFADATSLGAIDGSRIAETSSLIASDASLVGSPSGDVWILSGGNLERFARNDTESPTPSDPWQAEIAPVFARSCAACHLPGGVSGTDLSTSAAWKSERDEIHDRVVVKQSMPPQGHPLSDDDRAAIRKWTEAGP